MSFIKPAKEAAQVQVSTFLKLCDNMLTLKAPSIICSRQQLQIFLLFQK